MKKQCMNSEEGGELYRAREGTRQRETVSGYVCNFSQYCRQHIHSTSTQLGSLDSTDWGVAANVVFNH